MWRGMPGEDQQRHLSTIEKDSLVLLIKWAYLGYNSFIWKLIHLHGADGATAEKCIWFLKNKNWILKTNKSQ